ncbi:MAG TPA: helix-turn-helix transcriptional regulator [Polyangiaceae bacterium]
MEKERAEEVIRQLGRRIAEIREDLGWTQQQAAEMLNMPTKNLQKIERGSNLTVRSLVRVASALGVPTRLLFDPPASKERLRGRPKKKTAT